MLRGELSWLGLAVLCAACQMPQKVYDVERSRTYAEDRAAIWEGVQHYLQVNGMTVVSADPATGVIVAERRDYQDAGWADCKPKWVTSRSSNNPRPTKARPVSRDLALEVTVREGPGGTEVRPVAQFTEQQIDPHRNWPFDEPCPSTGMLESALLSSLNGATPATPSAAQG